MEVPFPLLGQDLAGRGPSGESRSHPGPKGSHLFRILLRSLGVPRVLAQVPLPLRAPETRRVAMVSEPPACSP